MVGLLNFPCLGLVGPVAMFLSLGRSLPGRCGFGSVGCSGEFCIPVLLSLGVGEVGWVSTDMSLHSGRVCTGIGGVSEDGSSHSAIISGGVGWVLL